MANRYSRLSASTFNPLSLQEIFTVPLARQKQHDETVAQIDKLGLFDINALDKDKDLANKYISGYQEDLDKLSDQIMKRGIDNLSKRQVMKLAKERDEWTKRGEGSKIVANYNAYKANAEQLQKMYQDGDISRDKYLLGLNKAKNSYTGVAEGGTYTPFSAVKDTEYMDTASDIAKAISDNPRKITQFAPSLQYNEETGKYIDVETKQEYTTPGAIKMAVRNGLMMDTSVISDLKQRKQLGMLGKASISDYIDGIAAQNEFIYAKNNVDQSRQFVGVDATERAAKDNEGATIDPTTYELANEVTFEQKHKGLSDTLNRMDSTWGKALNATLQTLRLPTNTQLGNGVSGFIANVLPDLGMTPTESIEFNRIHAGLIKNGVISNDSPMGDQIKAVQNYLNENAEITFSPVLYTNGLYKTYENQDAKIKQSTPQDLAKSFMLNPEYKNIIDPTTGKVVKYEELSDDDRKYIEDGKAKVSGVYGPRNFLADQYPGLNPDDLVSPMVIQLSGNKKYIVGRPTSEKNSPGYQAAAKTNEIWRNISYPDIDYKTTIPGLGDVTIVRSVTKDPGSGYLTDNKIKITTSEGRELILKTDGQLERFMEKLYIPSKGE